MAFERFVPRSTRTAPARAPRVTIRPSGLVSFDAAAVAAFDLAEATHVVLFFDRGRKALAVKPTSSAGEEGALPLLRRRRSVAVNAAELLERHGFALARPCPLPAGRDRASGMLAVSLKSIPRRRGRPRQAR